MIPQITFGEETDRQVVLYVLFDALYRAKNAEAGYSGSDMSHTLQDMPETQHQVENILAAIMATPAIGVSAETDSARMFDTKTKD